MAATAGVLAWTAAPDDAGRWRVVLLFGANWLLHLLWSPLFFKWKRPDWALMEVPLLWLSVLAIIVGIAPFTPLGAWLMAPYLAWVAFAAYLNLTIVRLNAPFR